MINQIKYLLGSASVSALVLSVAFAKLTPAVAQSLEPTSDLDPAAPLTSAVAAQLAQNVDRKIIVVMKSGFAGLDAEYDQAPIMRELGLVSAKGVKPFRMVNAFAATVSDGEVERLKANPGVAFVRRM